MIIFNQFYVQMVAQMVPVSMNYKTHKDQMIQKKVQTFGAMIMMD